VVSASISSAAGFIETMTQLRADPFEPSLRLHPLTGKLQGMQALASPTATASP